MSRRILACVFGLLIIAVLGVWQVFTGDTFIRQERRMKQANEHIPIVMQALAQYPEFKDLKAGVYTGKGGSLAITGFVANEKDVENLKRVVEQTKPPTVVAYSVFVTP